ncbi:MAG: hypothetical protein ACREEW_14735 [Caulobacteraceae bacterium]
MTRSAALLALALALIALPATTGAETYSAPPGAYPINPGYWEATYNWFGLISTTNRYCVEPKNIVTFLAKPCNHIYHCNYPVSGIKDGKAYFEGTITGNNELYHVRGGGTYTPTELDMHAKVHGHYKLLPVPNLDLWIKGHFISSTCPPGAKHFHQHS